MQYINTLQHAHLGLRQQSIIRASKQLTVLPSCEPQQVLPLESSVA